MTKKHSKKIKPTTPSYTSYTSYIVSTQWRKIIITAFILGLTEIFLIYNKPLVKKTSSEKSINNTSTNSNKIKEVNAYIEDDTIIPGMSGKEININKSFNNMKEYNTFVEDYLVYDNIIPIITLEDNIDKYYNICEGYI